MNNFKAFHSLRLDLRPLTILTGTNSSGKSSIMQALALLEQSRGQDPAGLVLNGPLVDLGSFVDVLLDRIDRDEPSDKVLSIKLEGAQDRGIDFSGYADLAADFVPPVAANGPKAWAFPWTRLTYIRADRIGPTLLHGKSHADVVRDRSIGSRGEYMVHYLLVNGDDPVHRDLCIDGADARLAPQCEAWLGELSTDARLYPSNVERTDAATLRFSNGKLSGLAGGREHRSTNVGFGLSYSLPIIVACLSSRPGDVLLIENPEAHLHPRGQSAMAELCIRAVRAGAQVILESHSDHVLNRTRVAIARKEVKTSSVSTYFFDRAAGSGAPSVRELKIDSDGSLDHWPTGFFDEYMNALLELSEF